MANEYLEHTLKTVRFVSQSIVFVSTVVFVYASAPDLSPIIKQAQDEVRTLKELSPYELEEYVKEAANANETRLAKSSLQQVNDKKFRISDQFHVENLQYHVKGVLELGKGRPLSDIVSFVEHQSGTDLGYVGVRWNNEFVQNFNSLIAQNGITGSTLNYVMIESVHDGRNPNERVLSVEYSISVPNESESRHPKARIPGYVVAFTTNTVVDWLSKSYAGKLNKLQKVKGDERVLFPGLKGLDENAPSQSVWSFDVDNAIAILERDLSSGKIDTPSVLGITVDSKVLVWFSPVILWLLVLYLLVHLNHLYAFIEKGSTIIQFPWVGFFKDKLSLILTVLSLGALPLLSCSRLLVRAGIENMKSFEFLGGLLFSAALLVSICFLMPRIMQIRKALMGSKENLEMHLPSKV